MCYESNRKIKKHVYNLDEIGLYMTSFHKEEDAPFTRIPSHWQKPTLCTTRATWCLHDSSTHHQLVISSKLFLTLEAIDHLQGYGSTSNPILRSSSTQYNLQHFWIRPMTLMFPQRRLTTADSQRQFWRLTPLYQNLGIDAVGDQLP